MSLKTIDMTQSALLEEIGRSGIAEGAYRFLHLGAETANFLFMRNGHQEKAIDLKLGIDLVADSFFKQEIPSEAEVENAINHIEDELMSSPELVNRSAEKLYCADALFVEAFAPEAGANAEYSRQAVEEAFTRYALISMGRSPVYDDVRMDRWTYAGILILREILHHLDFASFIIGL